MPQRYIAFLRAINVGGHTVKMDTLRQLFTALDFTEVETFIASGNVIFTAPAADPTDPAALERRIEAHLQAALGYAVATFLRTPAELAAVAEYDPFPAAPPEDGATLYIGLLPHAPADPQPKIQKLKALAPTDAFHLHTRELYWRVPTGLSNSPLTGARLEKLLGLPTTLRNSTTVRKLAAKYPPTP
jgi:uncharacterized protein (DUF1697 family)